MRGFGFLGSLFLGFVDFLHGFFLISFCYMIVFPLVIGVNLSLNIEFMF